MLFWISIRDAFIRLFEVGQNLFDASLLFSERNNLLSDLGDRAYHNPNQTALEFGKDLFAELRIIETKIKDLENEINEVFAKSESADPLDWI